MNSAIVAMSGGVDSSVAALLLKNQGYNVIGITFKNFDQDRLKVSLSPKSCCSIEHLNNARKVCDSLGIQHYVINRVEQFEREVLDNFLQAYSRGITPNPCVRCNSLVRWPELIRLADQLNAQYVATGHYAKLVERHGRFMICRSDNSGKDQSYALWGIKPSYLSRTLFPVGQYSKAEVRNLAAENCLSSAQLPESQDICFVPEGKYTDLLDKSRPGDIVDSSGKILGEHKGLQFYTVGQRRGLGISYPEPLYVIKIDLPENRLVVGTSQQVFERRFKIADANWFSDLRPGSEFNCSAKIRYRHEPAPCRVTLQDKDKAEIEFNEPQRAITPGQSAVFYDENILLGGGVIQKVF